MDKYGIIGYPLGHSFSRGFFTEKFAREHIEAQYMNFEIPNVEMLREVLNENPELRGLNRDSTAISSASWVVSVLSYSLITRKLLFWELEEPVEPFVSA